MRVSVTDEQDQRLLWQAFRTELLRFVSKRVADESVAEADERAEAELAQCLRPLMGKLPEKYREALVATTETGLTQKQYAAQMGLFKSKSLNPQNTRQAGNGA